jgi:hydroxymethylpyrimidine/phosphomethylpyrimidine kinase
MPPIVLTIAGTDSGGAAGLAADLRTFAALGVYGLCAITAVTAQDSEQVTAVQFMSPDFVAAQMAVVLADYGAAATSAGSVLAVKTGFIGREETVEAVARQLALYRPGWLVVDPVLVNQHAQPMFSPDLVEAYRAYLLPLADLITPNWHEAALLTHSSLPAAEKKVDWLAQTARALYALGPRRVLITGVPLGTEIVDLFFDGQTDHLRRVPRLNTPNTHGSGDTLSAATAAFLAKGEGVEMAGIEPVEVAVQQAQQFTHQAIERGANWQLGSGHGPVWQLP